MVTEEPMAAGRVKWNATLVYSLLYWWDGWGFVFERNCTKATVEEAISVRNSFCENGGYIPSPLKNVPTKLTHVFSF